MPTPQEQSEPTPLPKTSGRRTPPGRLPPAPPKAPFPRRGPSREPDYGRLLEHFERKTRAQIEKNPSNAFQHEWLATLLFRQGREEEALGFARRAAELAPESLRIRSDLASTYEEFGFHELASLELDACARLLDGNQLS